MASDAADGTASAKINTIVGGDGSDKITGGSNADTIYTAGEDPGMPVDANGPIDAESDPNFPNVVDTGLGSDNVFGSTWIDLVTSHSQPDQRAAIRGGANNDVLLGGYGTDEVYGGSRRRLRGRRTRRRVRGRRAPTASSARNEP